MSTLRLPAFPEHIPVPDLCRTVDTTGRTKLSWSAPLQLSPRMILATDASAFKRVASCAWVSSTGGFSVEVVGALTSDEAEVAAFIMAVQAVPAGVDLTIITDSQSVAHRVRAIQAGSTEGGSELECAIRNRAVSAVWVKGHRNHTLNVLADRLAYTAGKAVETRDLWQLCKFATRYESFMSDTQVFLAA